MTPAKTAISNLTDYECRITNRVIEPFQATPFLPAGTQQWRAEMWHKGDDKQVGDSGWEPTLCYAWLAAEGMFERLQAALEKIAELEAQEIDDADADYGLTALPKYQTADAATKATDRLPVVKPITGWRRLLIKWRLRMQYRAECRAAAV